MSSPNQKNNLDQKEKSDGLKKLTEGLSKAGEPLENTSSQSSTEKKLLIKKQVFTKTKLLFKTMFKAVFSKHCFNFFKFAFS